MFYLQLKSDDANLLRCIDSKIFTCFCYFVLGRALGEGDKEDEFLSCKLSSSEVNWFFDALMSLANDHEHNKSKRQLVIKLADAACGTCEDSVLADKMTNLLKNIKQRHLLVSK